jgi:hypothetical protein
MPGKYGIKIIGKLFQLLLYLPPPGVDCRAKSHVAAIASWLRGADKSFRPLDLVKSIYHYRYSSPSWRASSTSERQLEFAPDTPETEIHYAKSALSTWATHLVHVPAQHLRH